MEAHLKLCGLTKTYADGTKALDNVSLAIGPGVFGLLGPNGAGKSTLMRTLATLQDADSGTAALGTWDLRTHKDDIRRTLGYLPQEFGLYPRVSAEALLSHLAILKGIPRCERRDAVQALLQETGLWSARRRKLGTYSGGMRQRFGIAQALLGGPRLVIVDEPTAGLDPAERLRLLRLLARIGEDVIIILSTHIVTDVSALCTDMALMSQGRVVLRSRPADAIETLRDRVWTRSAEDGTPGAEQWPVLSSHLAGGRSIVRVLCDHRPDAGAEPADPDLQDVYFATMLSSSDACERGPRC